jgi:glyoxylate/succinic semialdehyde reductase
MIMSQAAAPQLLGSLTLLGLPLIATKLNYRSFCSISKSAFLPSFQERLLPSLVSRPLVGFSGLNRRRSYPLTPTRTLSARASSKSSAMDKKLEVGFLGIGIMGFAMARNLIKAGYNVTVWNRNPSKCDALVKEGAKLGPSPQQTAAACDITFAMLADPAGATAVALGENGAVKGLGPNKGDVDVSTVDGDTSKKIAEAVRATGAQYIEAPVSGSKKPAEDGALIFLAAGDEDLYNKSAPMLDVMGKARYFLGEVGHGAALKLVVNMIMGTMMASFSEGLVLGNKVGLDPETIVKVVGDGAINAPMFQMKGPSMVKGTYPTAFPLKHQQKDLRLALAMAQEEGLTIPVAASANEQFERAKTDGHGDDDFSAVIEVLRKN